jgi:hypothetical protein
MKYKLETTMQPGREIEVDEADYLDLTRAGVVVEESIEELGESGEAASEQVVPQDLIDAANLKSQVEVLPDGSANPDLEDEENGADGGSDEDDDNSSNQTPGASA